MLVPVSMASAVLVAAWPALRAFRVAGAPGVLVAAAAVPAAVVLLAVEGAAAPAGVSYTFSLAALLLMLLAADGPHPVSVARALIDVPNRLLTETLPLSGGRALLTPLVVLTWVAVAVVGEMALRVPGRRRSPASMFAVPVGLYLACYAAASSAPGGDRSSGPVLLLLVAFAAVARHRTAESQVTLAGEGPYGPDDVAAVRSRAGVWGVGAAAIVAAGSALAAATVPYLAERPAALHRHPPTRVPLITDPVAAMAQLRDAHPRSKATPLMTADLSGPSTGYMAVAYLDGYDGARWTFGGTFRPTGGRIPGPPNGQGVIGQQVVVQHVDVYGRLPTPLLPALDRPVDVSGLAVAADGRSGMLLPQAVTGRLSYTVVSSGPERTLPDVPAADGIDAATASPADTQIPADTAADVATTLRFLASQIGQRPAPTVAFLQDVLATLQSTERRIDPAASASGGSSPTTGQPLALGGTSLSEVINAVTVNRSATPEQFATFFAMVARYLGVPARVVTGFRIAAGPSGGEVAGGVHTITNRQAWTWVEIPVSGLGWVVCDPTPALTTAASSPPPEAVQATTTTVAPRQANAVPRSQILGGHALAPRARVKLPRVNHQPAWLWAVPLAAGMILLALFAGPGQAWARRHMRRRHRRSAVPAELAVGAWLELLDGLERAGMTPSPGATAHEVAGEVANHFGPELAVPAAHVARVADQAIFSTGHGPDAEAAAEAWRAQVALRRQISAGLELRQRLRASLLVGSAPGRPSLPSP